MDDKGKQLELIKTILTNKELNGNICVITRDKLMKIILEEALTESDKKETIYKCSYPAPSHYEQYTVTYTNHGIPRLKDPKDVFIYGGMNNFMNGKKSLENDIAQLTTVLEKYKKILSDMENIETVLNDTLRLGTFVSEYYPHVIADMVFRENNPKEE